MVKTRNTTRTVLTLAVVAMASLILTARSASAVLLVHEPFAYPDGKLTGQGGALGTTGTWTAFDTNYKDWHVHPEGGTSGIVVDPGPPISRNMYDGTVANLVTSGGFAGLPGPADTGADPDLDHEIGRHQNASIALDPSVTATFQSGTTTWFSFVSVRGWDRNEQGAHMIIGTDPGANENRGLDLTNEGNGIGGGSGPPRNNRTDIFPQFFSAGVMHNANGTITAFGDAPLEDDVQDMSWEEFDADGFGAINIVVGKIQWDADTAGEDILSVVRFLETETLSEVAFDALIAAQPDLSSANWDAANKPSLDQTQFDLLDFAGSKFFIDEIRIATTFDEAVPIPEPATMSLLALGGIGILLRRRRA